MLHFDVGPHSYGEGHLQGSICWIHTTEYNPEGHWGAGPTMEASHGTVAYTCIRRAINHCIYMWIYKFMCCVSELRAHCMHASRLCMSAGQYL
jgi:hypothetical protein